MRIRVELSNMHCGQIWLKSLTQQFPYFELIKLEVLMFLLQKSLLNNILQFFSLELQLSFESPLFIVSNPILQYQEFGCCLEISN